MGGHWLGTDMPLLHYHILSSVQRDFVALLVNDACPNPFVYLLLQALCYSFQERKTERGKQKMSSLLLLQETIGDDCC